MQDSNLKYSAKDPAKADESISLQAGQPADRPNLRIVRSPDRDLDDLLDYLFATREDAIPKSSVLCVALGWSLDRLRNVVDCGVAEGVLVLWEKSRDPSVMLSKLEAERRKLKIKANNSKGKMAWRWIPIDSPDDQPKRTARSQKDRRSAGIMLECELTPRSASKDDPGFNLDRQAAGPSSIASVYIDACDLYEKGLIRLEYLEEAAKSGIAPYRLGVPWERIPPPPRKGDTPPPSHPPAKPDPGPLDECPECQEGIRPSTGKPGEGPMTTYCLRCDRAGIAIPAGKPKPKGAPRRGLAMANPRRHEPLPEPKNEYERQMWEELRGRTFRK